MSAHGLENDEAIPGGVKGVIAALPRRALAVVAVVMAIALGLLLHHHARRVGMDRARPTIFVISIPHTCQTRPCSFCEPTGPPVPPWSWTRAEWADLFLWWRRDP